MTTTTKQTKRWIVRVAICAALLVALFVVPPVVMILVTPAPAPYSLIVLWMVFSLIPWWVISRRIMLRANYQCPRCGGCAARFERAGDYLDLVCPNCGLRESSDYVRFGQG